jgi:SpoIID/LytB domain protein
LLNLFTLCSVILLNAFFITTPISAEDVRIGIFAKYSLTEIEIKLEDAKINYQGKYESLKNGIWNVKITNGKILFTNENTIIQGEHIFISSIKAFTIYGTDNGENVDRLYKGNLELYAKDRKIILVLSLPLEEYVSSSTYSELGELLSANRFTNEVKRNELIAAQEIVIRTYIVNEKKRHISDGYDFCDLTHCIHFAGTVNKQSLHPGIILSGDSSVNGYFHSTCGGNLTGPEVFWSKHKMSSHYRRGIDGEEPNCKDSPHLEWETLFTKSEMESISGVKHLVSIQPIKKEERIKALRFTNRNMDTKVIPISTFFSHSGKLYGWNKIKSNDFTIEKTGDIYKIKGRGLGHGIGLCQWGASSLATKGKSHKEILEFYFPNTGLKNR